METHWQHHQYEQYGEQRFDGEELLSKDLTRHVWIVEVTGGRVSENGKRYVYPRPGDDMHTVFELLTQPVEVMPDRLLGGRAPLKRENFLRMHLGKHCPFAEGQDVCGPALSEEDDMPTEAPQPHSEDAIFLEPLRHCAKSAFRRSR